ncbi:MAG: ubiquinol-cytochrome c reductase iron-sulfur subunit [Candidatus Eremiobacteraeota bacterium]|nr:ubiquinol-cytochrome c reductase iron-sulfur subunit [Candidatus Eremiobacteraeota bacterium]MBV8355409.1 ubiquinol-cytochrome c reductase iron-sulfur subunit [Candidatus Eremiobacteraeota bacterium]
MKGRSPRRRAERRAALALVVSILGSALFATEFALGGQTQLEGLGLGLACWGIAAALVVWSRDLMPHETVTDQHHAEESGKSERELAADVIDGGLRQVADRRSWLVRLGWTALGALGIAALFPLRSFGPNPAGKVGKTNWQAGLGLVTSDGTPVNLDALEPGNVVTAFPRGFTGPDYETAMASDAVMLIRVDEGSLHLPSERASWTPSGCIAYSKVCTHAGCPVALYRQGPQQLMCPCHQSVFDVLDGGSVVFGPAVRALPQLPLALDRNGNIQAAGKMSDFVGPDTWEHA